MQRQSAIWMGLFVRVLNTCQTQRYAATNSTNLDRGVLHEHFRGRFGRRVNTGTGEH